MIDDKRASMQRVRVGLTGLGAVLLVVAVSTVIFETARQASPADSAAANRTEQVVTNMLVNQTEAPSEPLAEIGLTPGAPAGQPAK